MNLKESSTVYHYQLVKKVLIQREFILTYIGFLLIFFAILIAVSNLTALISIMLGYVVMQSIHLVITSVILFVKNNASMKSWSLQYKFPWFGYLPSHPISAQQFILIQMHLMVMGFVVIACLISWISTLFLITLMFFHIWMLLPRFIAVLYSYRYYKTSLIKLNPGDISYYKS